MPLLPDQLDDFVNLTQKKFIKKKWVDISLDRQEHIFASRMFKNKGTTPDAVGPYLNWKVQVTNTGSFKDSEMYGVDTTAVVDLTKEAQVEWTKQTVNYIYDIDERVFQGDDMTMIIDEISVRTHSMYNDFFDGMETRMWTSPTSPTADPRKPFGIPFWVQASTTAAFGFNGTNPSGFTDGAGGLSSTTYPNWANGTFTYSAITDDDLLDKWSEATDKCYFMAPHRFEELAGGMGDWGFYTVHGVLQGLRRLLKSSNDQIGLDLFRYRGDIFLKSNPVTWVPALTNTADDAYDSKDPVYGINWKTIAWCFQRNRNQIVHRPIVAPGQHTVRQVHMDNWGNFKCYNRRLNFRGQTA